jgi:hypothetical protein
VVSVAGTSGTVSTTEYNVTDMQGGFSSESEESDSASDCKHDVSDSNTNWDTRSQKRDRSQVSC